MEDSAQSQRTAERLGRNHKRNFRIGLAVSILLHGLVFIVFRGGSMVSPFAAAGPRAGDDRAAAGGGLQAVALRVAVSEPIPRPPDPVAIPKPAVRPEDQPEPEFEPVEFGEFEGEAGHEEGTEKGPGLDTGEGEGDAGTAARGRFRVIPPTPRGMIFPPSNQPDDVDGREVEVWVFVTAAGQVVPDSTRLIPPTGNDNFDARLRRQAAEWVFEPAKRGGEPVARWFQYIISL